SHLRRRVRGDGAKPRVGVVRRVQGRAAPRGLQEADGAESADGRRVRQRRADRDAPGPPERPGGGVEPAHHRLPRRRVDAQDGAGVRFRAIAGRGLAREELQAWDAALADYEAVAKGSSDSTLRDWARERASAVKARLNKPASGTTPAPSRLSALGSELAALSVVMLTVADPVGSRLVRSLRQLS